jgi:3-hydroxy-9,10-secoandrosta-1,3,5(10)-triene-9,17-dione monooxygenase
MRGEPLTNHDAGSIATTEELVARARALAPAFRERAAVAEQARTMSADSVAEVLDAGFTRILLPRRVGGYGLGLETSFEVVREIGKADVSHAWCTALMIEISHYIACYPQGAQNAVWAGGPDVALAGSLLPHCEVTAVEGGYRLSGHSPFTSGVNHALWVFLGGMITVDEAPQWALFLASREQYEIVDTWTTAGMSATGSNTVVTRDAFVPDSHVLTLADLREGHTPGAAMNDAPLARSPHIAWAPLTFVAPLLGAAQGAYEEFVAWTADRTTPSGERVAELPSMQTSLGRVAANLDAAELLLRRNIATAQAPKPPSLALRARAMRDYARSTELIVEAIDALVAKSGSAAFASSNPLQRAWRDIHFAANHASLNPENNYSHWGRTELGIERPPLQPFF